MSSFSPTILGLALLSVAVAVSPRAVNPSTAASNPALPQATPLAVAGHRCDPRTRITSIPYAITAPGSYVVTRNLIAASAVDGITVSASDVSIDLFGFVLDGATLGTNGIIASGGVKNLTVHNGSIRRWNASGIDGLLASGARYEDLEISENALLPGTAGLAMGFTAVADRCVLVSNGSYAVRAYTNCIVTNCAVGHTNGIGILVDARSTVRGCNVLRSLGAGISAAGSSTIVDNDLIENAGNGIEFLAGGGRGRIEGNNLATNGGAGVFVHPSVTLISVVRNHATGNSPNYSLPAICGAAPTGCASTTTNPWANLEY